MQLPSLSGQRVEFGGLGAEPSRPLLPLIAACVLAGALVAVSDASLTWLVLILIGCLVVGLAFWFGDVLRVALFMFIVTLPIDISKAIIGSGGVYSPGLAVFVSDFFFVTVFALWAYRQYLVRRQSIHLDRTHRVALVFLVWLWISACYSEDLLAGSLAAVTYTKFFITYFLLTQLIRKGADLRLVFSAFFAGFALQAVYVLAQVVTGSALEIQGAKVTHLGTQLVFEDAGGVHAFRPSGFLHHPNVLADYLVFLLPTAAALVLLGSKLIGRKNWIAAASLLVVGMAVLVITLSRGGWISLAVATIFFMAVGLRGGLVTRQHIVITVSALLIGVTAVAIVFPTAILRITQSDERSSESRLLMIDQALLIIKSNPVIGVGFGGYNRAAQIYTPESFSFVSTYFQDDIRKGVVHNKYLLVAAELGLIGFGLFVYLLWRFFRLLFPLSQWRNKLNFAIALGLSSSILGQATFYLFDHFYADVRSGMLWTLFGIYHALVLIQRNGPASPVASGAAT